MNSRIERLHALRDRARVRGAAKRRGVYMVEGETLTYQQIGDRLGCSASVAKRRMVESRMKGALTWEVLQQ